MSILNLRQTLVLLTFLLSPALMLAQKGGHTLTIQVKEKATGDAVIMATVQLEPSEAVAVTNADGVAVVNNVPAGDYRLRISYVGFQTLTTQVHVASDLRLDFRMTPLSLALKEVSVTARHRENGASTTSVVGRQAIDHLQATSLADVMQLIPGQLMGNHDLTQQANLQLRTLVNNNTSAFGASIVVDGVPMSNNGALSQGGFSATAFTGTDLRSVAADNIDEVEVVRGIPSAEYGDLTSGLVVVRSKVGVTPLQVRAKLHPGLENYSVGKGFSLGKAGIVNLNADYAKAWGDPREKTRSFDRYTFGIGWGKKFGTKWTTDTKLRYVGMKDWNGNDPDARQSGNETSNRNFSLNLTHNGHLQADKPLMRKLSYTVGVTYSETKDRQTDFVGRSTGRTDIVTAMQTGYNNVSFLQGSYQATGITESRPGSIFAKVSDNFFWRKGKTVQRFKLGGDYRYDWNDAPGYYNVDDSRPFKPNGDSRPRPFRDIPALHQVALFAEDQLTWNITGVQCLRVGLGLRFQSMQPFNKVATTALSPRLNVALSVTPWMDLRGGVGMNAKTPGLNYLYPDKKYADQIAARHIDETDPATNLVNYHTQVYNVEYSRSLKNATTTKVEAGIDVKLPGQRRISLLAYRDKTPNGFGTATEYTTYYHDTFEPGQGLIVTPGQPTTIDFSTPATHYLYFMTTGRVGNTNTTVNRGIEADIDLGEISPLNTSVYLSGAWSETKTWSTDLNSSTPSNELPAADRTLGRTTLKMVYPSGEDFSRYRRFVTTLRLVTRLPQLRMVASLTTQVIWHNSNWSHTSDKDPVGWIDSNLAYHALSPSQLNGYIGYDDMQWHETTDKTQHYISLANLHQQSNDDEPSKQAVTWNTQARLSKELGNVGSLSFFVSNALFYEPYLSSNKSSTLTQRNTGTFSFGTELSINL